MILSAEMSSFLILKAYKLGVDMEATLLLSRVGVRATVTVV